MTQTVPFQTNRRKRKRGPRNQSGKSPPPKKPLFGNDIESQCSSNKSEWDSFPDISAENELSKAPDPNLGQDSVMTDSLQSVAQMLDLSEVPVGPDENCGILNQASAKGVEEFTKVLDLSDCGDEPSQIFPVEGHLNTFVVAYPKRFCLYERSKLVRSIDRRPAMREEIVLVKTYHSSRHVMVFGIVQKDSESRIRVEHYCFGQVEQSEQSTFRRPEALTVYRSGKDLSGLKVAADQDSFVVTFSESGSLAPRFQLYSVMGVSPVLSLKRKSSKVLPIHAPVSSVTSIQGLPGCFLLTASTNDAMIIDASKDLCLKLDSGGVGLNPKHAFANKVSPLKEVIFF